MTNKIEQIIADEISGALRPIQVPDAAWTEIAGKILTALDAAGLAVLPKEATRAMCAATLGMDEDWRAMVARFNPSTWEPTE